MVGPVGGGGVEFDGVAGGDAVAEAMSIVGNRRTSTIFKSRSLQR